MFANVGQAEAGEHVARAEIRAGQTEATPAEISLSGRSRVSHARISALRPPAFPRCAGLLAPSRGRSRPRSVTPLETGPPMSPGADVNKARADPPQRGACSKRRRRSVKSLQGRTRPSRNRISAGVASVCPLRASSPASFQPVSRQSVPCELCPLRASRGAPCGRSGRRDRRSFLGFGKGFLRPVRLHVAMWLYQCGYNERRWTNLRL
jgi:hypothetical protein